MQDTINDAMDMAFKLACLLTKEQRVKMKYTGAPPKRANEEHEEEAGPTREDYTPSYDDEEEDTPKPNSSKPRIEIVTVNREYCKLCGSNGDTINSFKALIRAIEPEMEIELLAADDNADRDGPRIVMGMKALLEEYTAACPTFFHDPQIEPVGGGFHITTAREVPPQMRAACERVFFNIGRNIKERAALTWEVV